MSNEFIQVSEDLTYTKPEQEMAGRGEYFSYLPSGASTVPGGSRVIFNIRSSTSFCDYGRSYCKTKIEATLNGNVVTTAPATLSCGGIQTIFNNITERVSGANFDSFDNYNQLAVIRNSLQSATRQTLLRTTEAYTGFTTSTNPATGIISTDNNAGVLIPVGGSTFCFPIPSNLSTVNKLIPLSMMNSWDLSYALQPVTGKSVFSNAGGANGYQVTMELVLFLVEPTEIYMQALHDNIKEGKTIDLAMTFVKSFPSNITASSSNNIQNIVGQLKSCSSLLQVITGVTGDQFSPKSATSILDTTQWLLDSKTYPINKTISSGAESIVLGLSAFNTRFGEMLPQARVNFISFSTGNGAIKSGVKLQSGNVQSNLTFIGVGTATDVCNTYISAEGVLRIGYQGSVVMDYR